MSEPPPPAFLSIEALAPASQPILLEPRSSVELNPKSHDEDTDASGERR